MSPTPPVTLAAVDEWLASAERCAALIRENPADLGEMIAEIEAEIPRLIPVLAELRRRVAVRRGK